MTHDVRGRKIQVRTILGRPPILVLVLPPVPRNLNAPICPLEVDGGGVAGAAFEAPAEVDGAVGGVFEAPEDVDGAASEFPAATDDEVDGTGAVSVGVGASEAAVADAAGAGGVSGGGMVAPVDALGREQLLEEGVKPR